MEMVDLKENLNSVPFAVDQDIISFLKWEDLVLLKKLKLYVIIAMDLGNMYQNKICVSFAMVKKFSKIKKF